MKVLHRSIANIDINKDYDGVWVPKVSIMFSGSPAFGPQTCSGMPRRVSRCIA